MDLNEQNTFCPASAKEWRLWLKKHHKTKASVWVIFHKKGSGKPFVSWSDAVDEALCFGWVDSVRKSLDEDRFLQFFGKRKPGSTWSKINKDKTERLIAGGLMAPAGMKSIETAKENGSWTILEQVEDLTIPADLEKEFKNYPGSKTFFKSLSKSARKSMLQWLVLAKRPETRKKRVTELTQLTAKKQKPKQF